MNSTEFLRWLEKVYATSPNEIGCDQLQVLLADYVDYEIAGNDPKSHLPQVAAHLAQCQDCADEYRGLKEVARLEAQGRLPEAQVSLAQFAVEPKDPEKVPA